MLEIIGSAGGDNAVSATVMLDGKRVGLIVLTLAQWDRLREHSRDAHTSERVGLQFGVEVGDAFLPFHWMPVGGFEDDLATVAQDKGQYAGPTPTIGRAP